jgi:hypothetical protein
MTDPCEVCGKPCLEADTAFCSDRCASVWQDSADEFFTSLLDVAREQQCRAAAAQAQVTGLWN